MLCQTIKKEKDCFFWNVGGCSFPGGQCRIVVENCEGCGRTEQWPTGTYCSSYAAPDKHWSLGICNMATPSRPASVERGAANDLLARGRTPAPRRSGPSVFPGRP
jgi:hypothetical protein